MQKLRQQFTRFLLKPYSDYILIGVLVGLIMILNLVWIFTETKPPHWDMARHLWNSLNYLELLQHSKLYGLATAYYYYPPLLYFVVLPFYVLFGASIPVAIFSNIVFMTILAFSMYGIGKQLWSRRAGLLATLFILCSPMLITQFKEFQLDAPLTALTSLSLYLLIRCREFASTKISLLLGISLGLGLLTKWTYGFIMAAPIALAICMALVQAYKEKRWQRLGNIMACLILVYTIASAWYATNYHQIMIDLTQNGVGAGIREGDPVVGSLASNMWYLWNLVSNQLYLIPALFLLVGLIFLAINKKHFWKNRYPIALVVGVLVFFTLLRNKDARYSLPALAGVGVLATYWIPLLKGRAKQIVALGLVAYLAAMFYVISFGLHWLPGHVKLTHGTYPITAFAQQGYIISAPSNENWQLVAVFAKISKLPISQRQLYYSGPDTIWFNSWDLAYYAKLNSVGLVTSPAQATIVLTRVEATIPVVQSADYDRFPLPDGGTLVYKENN